MRRSRLRTGAAGAFRAALTAALLVAGSAAPSSFSSSPAAAAPEPAVSPAEVAQSLPPGGSLTVDKRVQTPAVPPRPDVVLLVDDTGSMEPSIENVRTNLTTITDQVRAEQPDSRFAVAAYGDEIDDNGYPAFEVLQPLTDDVEALQNGVDRLEAKRGYGSTGPSEDWINALWQTANGAAGEFRENASPIIVLVGDASSHDPSLGHTLTDAVTALRNQDVRVVAVDVKTDVGDGLNGTGDAGDPDYVEDPLHEPDQATKVVEATEGRLLENTGSDQVADAIVEGLTNLPTTVGYELVDCDPSLVVTLDPATRTVTSGETAEFTETIAVDPNAAQGTALTCTVQFTLGTQDDPEMYVASTGGGGHDHHDHHGHCHHPGGGHDRGDCPTSGPSGSTGPGPSSPGPTGPTEPTPTEPAPDPGSDYQQHITIAVTDVTAPVVTVDDRTAVAADEDGVRIDYTATAEDAVEGPLPITCTPPSGSLFPVGTTTVTCTATDSAGNTGTDTATFQVLPPVTPPPPPSADLAVTATLTPDPAYTGGEVTVRLTVTNAGPDTATDWSASVTLPEPADRSQRTVTAQSSCTAAGPCTLRPGERAEVTVRATYRTAITGAARATVTSDLPDPDPADNTDTATLTVLEPRLTVDPEVATPGQVVLARGTDFPPGTVVRLRWTTGITADRTSVRVRADGTFQAQVLVLRKDTLGPRDLRASGPGYTPLTEEVLVAPRSVQPPDFAGRG